MNVCGTPYIFLRYQSVVERDGTATRTVRYDDGMVILPSHSWYCNGIVTVRSLTLRYRDRTPVQYWDVVIPYGTLTT